MRLIKSLVVPLIVATASTCESFAHVPEVRHMKPLEIVQHPATDGRSAEAWCAAHMRRGELVQALFDCDYAVSQDPRNVQAISNRGAVFLMTHDAEKALSDFEAALKLEPERAVAYYNRGLALARLGRTREAISDYSRAIKLQSDLAIAYHNRGHEYEALGDRDQAIADYERALQIEPGLVSSSRALARLKGRH